MALPVALEERLSEEDDPRLWEEVLKVLGGDASILEIVNGGSPLYVEVGACSHWLRPHQTRWTAAGGFAWPTGYGGSAFSRTGLPILDWSIALQFDQALGWIVAEEAPGKRSISVRVAVPNRTMRHPQAAVHSVWPPRTLDARRKRTVFYGFRKSDGEWELKACSRDRERLNRDA